MPQRFFLRRTLLAVAVTALAAPTLLAAAFPTPATSGPARAVTLLDGQWRTIVDPYENGYYDYRYLPHPNGYFNDAKPAAPDVLQEYDFDTSATLQVPGDWNSQRPELFLYENTVWYRRLFDYAELSNGRRLFVHFGAVNYEARVYLNGAELGLHTGGFTPFGFEITEHVKTGQNSLVVKVDASRRREGVPTVNTDWWNYGGLTRSVHLIEVPRTYIREVVLQLDVAQKDQP